MRTDYFGHDKAYKKRRAAGLAGWDPADISVSVFRQFESLLCHAAVPQASRLIEFGCGAGNLSVGFANLGFDVTSVDISPTAIEWARDRARDLGLDITFRVENVVTLLDPSSIYSVAVDSHCLHCLIGPDRATFLTNAHQLLSSDGALIVNSMCRNENTHTLDGFDPTTGIMQHNGIATRFIGTREEIEEEIRRAGFGIVDSRVEADHEQMDDLLVVALPIREA